MKTIIKTYPSFAAAAKALALGNENVDYFDIEFGTTEQDHEYPVHAQIKTDSKVSGEPSCYPAVVTLFVGEPGSYKPTFDFEISATDLTTERYPFPASIADYHGYKERKLFSNWSWLIGRLSLVAAWLYAFGAIRSWDFNPGNFGWKTRGLMALVMAFAAYMMYIYKFVDDNEDG